MLGLSWLRSLIAPSGKAAPEGAFREGPYVTSSGWIPASWPWNFWQQGRDPLAFGQPSAMVEACLAAYSQTVAMCPGSHWLRGETGGRTMVETSALSRFLRRPNDYQSPSDYFLNVTRSLMGDGAAFVMCLRNDRNEISEAHQFRTALCRPLLAEDGSIFYELEGNEIIRKRMEAAGIRDRLIVPARDVMHLRLHTPRHPLVGDSPIMAAALEMTASDTILNRQVAFFANRSRPSFVLTTNEKLTREQARELRERWEEHSQGLNEGKTPVLSWGVEPKLLSTTAADSQMAEMLKLSDEHIALAYRMPLQIVGKGESNMGSTEALMNLWLASGLGFVLNHIEQGHDRFFGLRGWPYEYSELDTSILLRSNFKDQIEGLSRGVISGVYAPDEARAVFELAEVPGGYGKSPRVQQQVVPLDWHEKQPAPTPTPPPTPPGGDEGDDEAEDQETPDDAARYAPAAIRSRLRARARELQ